MGPNLCEEYLLKYYLTFKNNSNVQTIHYKIYTATRTDQKRKENV